MEYRHIMSVKCEETKEDRLLIMPPVVNFLSTVFILTIKLIEFLMAVDISQRQIYQCNISVLSVCKFMI